MTEDKFEYDDQSNPGDVPLLPTKVRNRIPFHIQAWTSKFSKEDDIENDGSYYRNYQDYCRVEDVNIDEFEHCVIAQRWQLFSWNISDVVTWLPDDVVLQEPRDVENDGADDDDGNLYSSLVQGQPSRDGERIAYCDETVNGQ